MSNVKNLIPIDQVTPTITRPLGAAWVAEPPCSKRVLANWLIYLPNRGPYSILFFTLRYLSLKEEKTYSQVTHGVCLYGVDSSKIIYTNVLPTLIVPLYSGQWFCSKNELAIELVKETVDDICMGRMNPFDEEKDDWVMRFGNNIEGNEEDLKISFVLSKEEVN